MAIEDVAGLRTRVQRFFREGISESFGRHTRAIERYLIDEVDTGLARIHVVMVPRLPVGVARMRVLKFYYDRVGGDEDLYPMNQYSRTIVVKHIYVLYGTGGMGGPDKITGYDLPTIEKHLDPLPRLAIAHELGHLALDHCLDSAGNIVPPFATSDAVEQMARLYALALVSLTSTYLDKKGHLLKPAAAEIRAAADQMWPDMKDDASACTHVDDILAGRFASVE